MIDGDLFVQYIDVPDDRPALPPVDEDIFGLKDFASLEPLTDLHIDRGYNEPSGLLLGPDLCHNDNVRRGVDTFDAITLPMLPYGTPPDAGQNAFLPTSNASTLHISSYVSLFPPALSPDMSPTSIASSTPWLRTPETDPSLASVPNVDALWDTTKTEVSCSTIHFLDQAGNNLEDIPSEVQDLMLEDIACTPQIISDTSLPRVFNATPCGGLGPVTTTPPSNTPIFVISPPCASASPIEAVPPGSAHCTSLPPSPHMLQSLFAFSPVTCHPLESSLPEYSASPSLSPLSTLSFFSQSPSVSPNPSPPIGCSSLSPTISPLPLSNSDERVEVTDSISSSFARVTSAKLRGKRSGGTFDDDTPTWKIPRRSKASNVDEEEWNPGLARVKRPRAEVSSKSTRQTPASIPDCPHNESSNCETGQSSEGHSDATLTSCEICGQGFTRASDYIRHIENSASHPETRKVWPCSYCDSTLGRKDALVRHSRTMHPGKPVVIPEGIPGSQLHEGQKELSMQRIGQRKIPFRRQSRKDPARRYR